MPNLVRTSILFVGLMSATASAEVTVHETVVHDTTTTVEVKLDASTVLCSSADYGALFLKILIPQLAGITLLDHQNTGAGAPCVASGMCKAGNMPSDIIDPYQPTATAAINVKAIRIDEADPTAQTCTTTLRETVDVNIRGIAFKHERFASLGERPFSDCAVPAPAPVTDEPKADGPGVTEEKTAGGGCSAGAGGGAAFLLLCLGALVAVRQRTRVS